MPKMKSNRGAYKRFRSTGTGKFRRRRAYKSHLLTSKSSKRKRQLRGSVIVADADEKSVKKMLPYGAR